LLRKFPTKGYNKVEMNPKFKKIIFCLIISAAFGLYFILLKSKTNTTQKNIYPPLSKIKIDESKPSSGSDQKEDEVVGKKESSSQIPEKFLINVPFYSQAPFSKWDHFHEEMCEEASVLNAGLYLQGKKLAQDQFEAELKKMQKIEKKEIGEWESTTITQTKELADIYFEGKIKSRMIDNPTLEEIESEIAAGNLVIVPLAGRDIGNPNFTPPGPVYHMLLIKGYDAQNFITNDVGTRKGNSYVYKKEVIMKNMHDWNETDIHRGTKRALALYK
jgi:hypothetical protein